MADPVQERHRERERLLGLAREYLRRVSKRLPVVAAAVVGSVARGDFNVWSDVDLVVIARGLPERTPERDALLTADTPGGVQPVGFTLEEFALARQKGNHLALEVAECGIALAGEEFFRGLDAGRAGPDRTAER